LRERGLGTGVSGLWGLLRLVSSPRATAVLSLSHYVVPPSPRVSSFAASARREPGGRQLSRDAGDRRDLDGFEVDERLVVVQDRLDLDHPRLRQIALKLRDEERRRHAGGEFLFLGVELLLLQLARGTRRLHALLVGVHVASGRSNLRGDDQLHVLELRLRLLVFEVRTGEVRMRRGRAERVADLEAEAPLRIGVAEDVAERRAV